MKKIVLLIVFCIFDLFLAYIITLDAVQACKVHSLKNIFDLIYSVFAFVIFLRVQWILMSKGKDEK